MPHKPTAPPSDQTASESDHEPADWTASHRLDRSNALPDSTSPVPPLGDSAFQASAPSSATSSSATSSSATSNSDASGSAASSPATKAPDSQLVEQTRLQIRGLVQEIAQLSQSDCELHEFLSGFASRITTALASAGIAIWLQDADERLELSYRANLPEELAPHAADGAHSPAWHQHSGLLSQLLEKPEAVLIPPASATEAQSSTGNPTPYLLVVAPLKVDREAIGLVEVFQRAGTGPTTQRGYLRFLVQMTDLAGDYFKSQRLRAYREQQRLWSRLEQFIRGAHQTLDLRSTAFQLANEGRRVLDCDRLTVATCESGRTRIQAVSGLDAIDRRAADLKQLTRVVDRVLAAGEPLWFGGDSQELPPQIEAELQPYLDQTHTKWIGVLPLYPTTAEVGNATGDEPNERDEASAEPLGALIVEQLSRRATAQYLAQRAQAIAPHASDALQNVQTYRAIPLVGLWQLVAKLKWFTQLRNLPTTLTILLAVAGVIATLVVVPADFEVSSAGSLAPQNKQHVFAPLDGTVSRIELPPDPEAVIPAGTPLIQLENRTLEVEMTDLEGQERQLLARQHSLRRATIEQHAGLDPAEEIRLETEAFEVEESLATVRRELEIKRQQLAELQICSPTQGLIADWQTQQRLQHRPVRMGQRLLTLVDPWGPWQLELEVPESDIGHLVRAQQTSDEALPVTFVLASAPESKFTGRLQQVHLAAEVRESQEHIVLVTVAFEKEDIPAELLRHGTKVQARIDCGRKPLGYVLFHDLIEAAHERILFWF